MKLLLTGASGFIGSHIHQALETQGHEIVSADRHHGIDFRQMVDAGSWLPWLEGVDAVINAVGIIVEKRGQTFELIHRQAPTALFHACEQAAVKRVIQISALGADEQAFTPYQLSKKAADDALRALPLNWFVLRPSLVIGAQSASLALFRRMAQLPVVALADGGRQLIQPVHVDDLVDTVLACLEAENGQQTLDVVGPQAMSFAQWLQDIRASQGKDAMKIIPILFVAILPLAHLGRWLLPIMHPDNLRMLQKGNTADCKPLEAFLQRPLRPPQTAL